MRVGEIASSLSMEIIEHVQVRLPFQVDTGENYITFAHLMNPVTRKNKIIQFFSDGYGNSMGVLEVKEMKLNIKQQFNKKEVTKLFKSIVFAAEQGAKNHHKIDYKKHKKQKNSLQTDYLFDIIII